MVCTLPIGWLYSKTPEWSGIAHTFVFQPGYPTYRVNFTITGLCMPHVYAKREHYKDSVNIYNVHTLVSAM